MDQDLRFQPQGETWEQRALRSGLRATMAPGDRKGKLNEFMDDLHKLALSPYLKLKGNEVLLDFGCGTGRISFWLMNRVKKVIGLDITQEMLIAAKHQEEIMRDGNIDFVHYDGTRFPLSNESFDLITSVWVLQHIIRKEDFSSIIAEISRILKKGGRLYMIEQISNDINANVGDATRSVNDFITISEDNRLKCIVNKPIRYTHSIFSLIFFYKFSPISLLLSEGFIPRSLLPLIAKLELICDQRMSPRSPKEGYVEHLFVFIKN